MKYLFKAMIISILLSSDKTIIKLRHGNQIVWPLYITIDNIDLKIWWSPTRSGILF